jgi:hypothetical protein
MKRTKILILLGLIFGCVTAARFLGPNGESGKSIFIANKCLNCHSIESQGIARTGTPPSGSKQPPDLSAVGERHTAGWMQHWLMKEEEMNGKKHIKKFGGSPDDLATLTNWLASLKHVTKSIPPTTKPKPRETHADTSHSKTGSDSVKISWNILADSVTDRVTRTLDTISIYYASDTLFIKDLTISQQRWQEYVASYLASVFPRDRMGDDRESIRQCQRNLSLPLIEQRLKDLRVWLEGVDSTKFCSSSSIKPKETLRIEKR